MTTEIYAVLSITVICWIVLLAADAVVSGVLRITAGIPFRKAFIWGCISLIIPPAVIAYGSSVGRNIFSISSIEIACQGLPESYDGYRIVHISDIHARSFEKRERQLQKAADKINGLNPDIVAFTGDLITMMPEELDRTGAILGSIKARDGVFSVLGNHDYCMYSDLDADSRKDALKMLVNKEREMGWDLLMNENRILRRGRDSIAVIGVENTSPSRHFPSKGNLTEASEGTEGMFRILLTHDPLHWKDEVIGQDYPLTLSGHTHAMQFSLFGWSPSMYLFPQYRGLYSTDNTENAHQGKNHRQYLYVNTGLGETIFPARIGVRPEITLITLHSSDI